MSTEEATDVRSYADGKSTSLRNSGRSTFDATEVSLDSWVGPEVLDSLSCLDPDWKAELFHGISTVFATDGQISAVAAATDRSPAEKAMIG